MAFKRKNKSVYISHDTKEFNIVRNALETAGIDYDYKIRNHQNKLLMPGVGTVRGRFGSLGMNMEEANEYEIKVFEKDADKANFIIRNNRIKR